MVNVYEHRSYQGMVDIICTAVSIIPIEIRNGYHDFFFGCSIATGQDDIDTMDPGHQIEVACPKISEITGFKTGHSID